MAKKKFIDKRNDHRRLLRSEYLNTRDKVEEIVEFISGLGLEVKVHRGDDEDDRYFGFELYIEDPEEEYIWIEILNPRGGDALEVALGYYGVQLVTKRSFQHYYPTKSGLSLFFEELKGYILGTHIAVRVDIEDNYFTNGIIHTNDLNATDWFSTIGKLILRDFRWSKWYQDRYSRDRYLKEKLRLISKHGCQIGIESWNGDMNSDISLPALAGVSVSKLRKGEEWYNG